MADWRDRAAWCVLDTRPQDGAAFASLWTAWENDPRRPPLLHYVAILPAPPDLAALRRQLQHRGPPGQPVPPLEGAGQPGLHRLEFSAGRVLLTLCIGPLQAMLRELQFVADAVRLGADPGAAAAPAWDTWALKALVRLCRRGTRLHQDPACSVPLPTLRQAGFRPDQDRPGHAIYDPAWEPGHSRQTWRSAPPRPSHCVVIGAGLAGACVAASLSRRGWQVTVLDAAASPAAAASSLPVGLLAPQVSRDNAARSRLSRAGMQLTLQWCRALLQEGRDWAPSGLRQRQVDDPAGGSLWHADGAWIKPARLVAACLGRPGIVFAGGVRVHRLRRETRLWQLLDAQGDLLAQAPQLVLACAADSHRLLQTTTDDDSQPLATARALRALLPVHGQLSWGWRQPGDDRHFPPTPLNGHGHLLPAVPLEGGTAWFAGASYEPASQPALKEFAAHADNRQRLARLAPQTEAALAPWFAGGQVRAWRGTRCTTPDRLPAVGACAPTSLANLWISAGMGSRGLSFAVLAAELLAARLGAEPLPVAGSLARLLAADRPGLSDHL